MLSEEEINVLLKKGYLFDRKTTEEFYENYLLLLSSLTKNYVRTINALRSYNLCDLNLKEMDLTTSKAIYKLLIDNNFVLSKNTFDFMEYNPLFLIASLENNYGKTLNLLIEQNNRTIYTLPSFEHENKILEDLLLDNNFVIAKKSVSLVLNSPSFLMASLKNSPDRTLNLLDKARINCLQLDKNQIRDLIEFFRNENITFKNLPNVLKNSIIIYVSQNWIDDMEYISSLFMDKFIPITYAPSNVLNMEYYLWDLYKDNDDEHNYIIYKSAGYESNNFNENDEKRLLNLLGKDYESCMQIEDVFRIMKRKHLSRDNMSMFELLAIQLYAAKELKKNGISRIVDVMAVDHKMDNLGTYNKKNIELYINAQDNEVVGMVNSVIHEIEHAIQFKNVGDRRIDCDKDIDLYSKDSILRNILGENYYDSNYYKISFEFDAALKAYIKTAQLFGLINEDEEVDYKSMKENATKAIEYARLKLYDETLYEQNALRYNFSHVNELFKSEMKKLKAANYKKYEDIIKQYLIILLDYNVFGDFSRKDIEQLIDDFDKSNNKQIKGVYFNLLRNRLDPSREEDELEDNINKIKVLYEAQKYSGDTQKILKKLFELSEEYVNNKYYGYFYKNKVNKR